MDDELLADDGQFKDDGLDDLDIDAEAALLGMSDEEIEDDSQSQNDDQELEYVDEEGNPVSIGENNADLYEVANIESDKLSNPEDEDILELDLDAELESFQETSDLLRESPTPTKTFQSPTPTKTFQSSAPTKTFQSSAPAKTFQSSAPAKTFQSSAPTKTFQSSAPTKTFQSSAPTKTFQSSAPTKTFSNDRHRKENLISLTSRKEPERPPLRRKESRYSPVEDQDKSNKDVSFSNQSHVSHIEPKDSFSNDLEYDEESEDESIADDHRERFKSERSNIITLTPAKRRSDIPDTLESVISVEETAKVQAFLENEQKRKMRFKGKMQGRGKPSPRFQRPAQNLNTTPAQQHLQLPSSNTASVTQSVSTAPQPRKILINPHFRGVRLPPPHAEQTHTINEPSPQPPIPPSSYEMSNFPPPPVQYSHQEPVHPVSVGPPPIYTAPPPTVQYKPPEYPPPQPPIQQIPPAWQQHSEMPVQSYSMPPPQPVLNYGDPVQQPSSYNAYNQNYPNTTYQNMPVPMPQSVNYSQPPPPVHLYTPSYPPQSVNPVSSNMAHTQYSPSPNHVRMQTSVQPQQYQQTPASQPQITSHVQKPRFPQNLQRFSRLPEKRPANTNIKHVPLKQPRLEHPPRKTNVHVNNSNIREIPLVDNLPAPKKTFSVNKTVPIVEEEDEKTKELRMKIEEQKLLREQVLKRKEERRRQMAAQRLMELKKRQMEQSKNTVTIIPKTISQTNLMQTTSTAKQLDIKPSVKDRIGPLNKNVPVTKKKIVVVRKKIQQPGPTVVSSTANTMKQLTNVGQRIKLPISSQKPNTEQTVKTVTNITATTAANQSKTIKLTPASKPGINDPSKSTANVKTMQNKPQATPTNQKNQSTNISKKLSLTAHALRIKRMRIGMRPNFQRPQFSPMQRMQRPRIPAPRGAQFPSPPFVGPSRMPFHGLGMNDIRMPPMNDIRRPLRPPMNDICRPPMSDICRPPMNDIRRPPMNDIRRPPMNDIHRPPMNDIYRPPMNDIRRSPMNDIRMPPPHFQDQRPPLLPFHHPHGEPARFNRFFPPEMQNNPPFRMRGPVPPNFRPGGMEPRMFHERFPSPQFRNQMPLMRPMMDNNMKRFQSPPRFQHQVKQRFSSNNSINQKPATTTQTAEVKSSPLPSQTSNVNQKLKEAAVKVGDGKSVSKISLARNQPKSFPNDKDIPHTQSVSIENLSSSTNEAQLRKLCSSVGVVENIQLLKTERKALIKFKEPRQALMFQKKYQRYMLDLAMIQVSLLPP